MTTLDTEPSPDVTALWIRDRRTGQISRWTRHGELSLRGDVLWNPDTPPGRRTFAELLNVGDVFDDVPETSRDLTGRARVRGLLAEAAALAEAIADDPFVPDRLHDRRVDIDQELAQYVSELLATIERVEALLPGWEKYAAAARGGRDPMSWSTPVDGAAVVWNTVLPDIRSVLGDTTSAARGRAACGRPIGDLCPEADQPDAERGWPCCDAQPLATPGPGWDELLNRAANLQDQIGGTSYTDRSQVLDGLWALSKLVVDLARAGQAVTR